MKGIAYRKSKNEAPIAGELVNGNAGDLLREKKETGAYSFRRADNQKVIKVRYFIADAVKEEKVEGAAFSKTNLPPETDPIANAKKSALVNRKNGGLRAYMIELISGGTFTGKEIMALSQKMFPETKLSTLQTLLADAKNPKYSPFKKVVKVNENKTLSFIEE